MLGQKPVAATVHSYLFLANAKWLFEIAFGVELDLIYWVPLSFAIVKLDELNKHKDN